MHNTGLNTATADFMYILPQSRYLDMEILSYRLARVDLASNETFFFEMNYPLVLVNQEKIVVDVIAPATQVEEQVLEVQLTSKSLAIPIFEVIRNGSRSSQNERSRT